MSNKQTVKITITTDYGNGRTSIAMFIAAQLRKATLPVVQVTDQDGSIEFDAAVENIKKLAERGIVAEIETVQLAREVPDEQDQKKQS